MSAPTICCPRCGHEVLILVNQTLVCSECGEIVSGAKRLSKGLVEAEQLPPRRRPDPMR
jgi:DNA-directed RNA polymerase subunit RPC12/RpoP